MKTKLIGIGLLSAVFMVGCGESYEEEINRISHQIDLCLDKGGVLRDYTGLYARGLYCDFKYRYPEKEKLFKIKSNHSFDECLSNCEPDELSSNKRCHLFCADREDNPHLLETAQTESGITK